jgi:hypothetical protein
LVSDDTETREPSPSLPPRSSHLLARERSGVLVIDIQEKLLPEVEDHRRIVWNASRLVRAAALLELPRLCSEQYPRGLGDTVPELRELLPSRHAKRDFSVSELQAPIEAFARDGRDQLVLCGIETHVCILQSALDLNAWGYDVYVVVDAIGSRHGEDHAIALQRMRDEGIRLVTTEGALFEWCASSRAEPFKAISRLVQETPSDLGPGIGFQPRRG